MIDLKGNKITYLGHATFSLTTSSGQVAMIDPFVMSNPACPESLKKVPRLDVIFVSHAHGDHIGDLIPLASATPASVTLVLLRICSIPLRT